MADVSPAAKIVANEVKDVVVKSIQDPETDLESSSPHLTASEIAQQVASAVDAVVAHLSDNEPWYQSRVVWGSIISLGGTIAALFGLNVSQEVQANYTSLAVILAPVVVGGATALYGRYFARKPLGT